MRNLPECVRRILLCGSLALVAGCSERAAEEETVEKTSLALTTAEVSMNVTLPEGVSVNAFALGANQRLTVADGVRITSATGAFRVFSTGTETTELGSDAVVGASAAPGTVLSRGRVWLRERARVFGDVRTQGAFDTQNVWTVDGSVNANATLPLAAPLNWSVKFQSGGPNVSLEPDQTRTLAPGAFGTVNVTSRSKLRLASGIYYLSSLTFEPQSELVLADANGPVILYVSGGVTWRGKVVGASASERLMLASVGTTQLDLDAPFRGSVFAPAAPLRLGPVDGSGHEGSFYAKTLDVLARNRVRFVPSKTWAYLFPQFVGAERAVGVPAEILARVLPDNRVGVTSLPSRRPSGGGLLLDLGVPQGAPLGAGPGVVTAALPLGAGTSSATTGTFRIRITSHTKGGDGAGFGAETYMLVRLANVQFGRDDRINTCGIPGYECPDFEAEVPSLEGALLVHLSLKEDDDFLEGDDDNELDVYLGVDNLTGAWTGRYVSDAGDAADLDGSIPCATASDGFGICWEIEEVAGRPRYCPSFRAQYLDSGLGETVLAGPGIALETVPASFAKAELEVHQGTTLVGSWNGVLDEDGCVPVGERMHVSNFEPRSVTGVPLRVTTKVQTDFCRDHAGTRCAGSAGVQVTVVDGSATGPTEVCSVFTEDTNFTAPGCFVRYGGSILADFLNFTTESHTAATRAAGLVATSLRRDFESDLGVINSFSGRGVYTVKTDAPCIHPSLGVPTSSTSRDEMCLALVPGTASDTFFKFIFVHEFGHAVQLRGSAMPSDSTTYDFDGGGRWGCGHFPTGGEFGSTAHCLQGEEFAGAAQGEGFAQFWAARVLNLDTSGTPVLNYYKPVLAPACLPILPGGVCEDSSSPGLKVTFPPMAVRADLPIAHRNLDPALVGRVAADPSQNTLGTEWDWMTFLWNMNKGLGADSLTMSQLLTAYQNAVADPGTAGRVSFDGSPVQPGGAAVGSLLESVRTLVGPDAEAARRFDQIGDTHAVSTDIAP